MSIFVGNGTTGVEARANRLGLPTGTTDPATANAGDTYYKTDTNKIRVYNGTVWADLASGGTGTSGVEVERSLRFNSSDSAYLSRTPASASNRKMWTWAGWVKRSALPAGRNAIFNAGTVLSGNSGFFGLRFLGSQSLDVTTGSTGLIATTAVFRDVSAWYHIVLSADTTIASNQFKLYVNGVLQGQGGSLPLNTDLAVNSTVIHELGRTTWSTNEYLDGYLADIHFIDGQALAPTAFTEVSATTGQLVPIVYTGTFGTNGFCLKFSDNSNNTAATLGNDYSSNNNDWTPNNLSVTAGAGNDSLVDTPTSYGTDTYGVGGVVRGNYATLNPISSIPPYGQTTPTLSNGNLTYSGVSAYTNVDSTIAITSGTLFFEVTLAGTVSDASAYIIGLNSPGGYYRPIGIRGNATGNGITFITGSNFSYGLGDVIGVAFNYDTNIITYFKNGAQQCTGTTNGALNVPVSAWVQSGGNASLVFNCNFGQRPFAYTAPSGFKALCDTNLPAPVIAKPNTVMDVKLYQGNGSTQTISGLGFSPDLVWIKGKSLAYNHRLIDSVRGVQKFLFSNLTDGEITSTLNDRFTSFDATGFTLGAADQPSSDGLNQSGGTYVAWTWDAGTTTASNTQGSITSQVRANVSAGFSIVTYTGNGVAGATRGHGLGVAPGMILIKGRTNVDLWHVYHSSLGNTQGLFLNSTNAATTSIYFWNNTSPTSTVFTTDLGSSNNSSGVNYVAYCFAPVVGYSSFGSYTGNGSADGPFVYTGFRPAFLMVKGTSAGYIWTIEDNKRDTFNPETKYLQPQASDAEGTLTTQDFTSNGFKIRTADTAWNGSGITYIYMAFAENPFQYARAR